MFAFVKDGAITKWPVDIGDLQTAYPSTSFPTSWEDFDYADYGVVQVEELLPPPYDPYTQQLTQQTPKFVDGKWEQNWVVEELSPEEKKKIEDERKLLVKNQAKSLLSNTDWTQIQDVDLLNKADFVQYRSELRDIVFNPQVDSVFPVKPEEQWG